MTKTCGMSKEGKGKLKGAGLVVDKKENVRVKQRGNKTKRRS